MPALAQGTLINEDRGGQGDPKSMGRTELHLGAGQPGLPVSAWNRSSPWVWTTQRSVWAGDRSWGPRALHPRSTARCTNRAGKAGEGGGESSWLPDGFQELLRHLKADAQLSAPVPPFANSGHAPSPPRERGRSS